MAKVPASLSLARIATDLPFDPSVTFFRPSGQLWVIVPPGMGTMQPPKPYM